jgi:hypothetical protein
MALLQFFQEYQILSGLGLLLLLAFAYHVVMVNASSSEPPLIKGYLPFFGVFPQAILATGPFLLSCRARHGEIFTLYILGHRVTIVTDPIEGVPAVFKQTKQLSFKDGLDKVFIKGLGFSEARVNEREMNRENYATFPPYLLTTNAVDPLAGQFIRYLLSGIREDIKQYPDLKTGRILDLGEWSGRLLFYATGDALCGEGIFDAGGDRVLSDYEKFDNEFPLRMILPTWMTNGFLAARTRLRGLLHDCFERGLKNPSEFVKKRIEVC